MVLYAFLFWNSLSILKPATSVAMEKLPEFKAQTLIKFRKLAMGAKGLVFMTAVSGAFVAGLDAGLTYNSFPLMAGKVIPDDLFAYVSWLSNFMENPTTVQYDHR
jgi:cytochrome c oxidase assembly protein subunit 15